MDDLLAEASLAIATGGPGTDMIISIVAGLLLCVDEDDIEEWMQKLRTALDELTYVDNESIQWEEPPEEEPEPEPWENFWDGSSLQPDDTGEEG